METIARGEQRAAQPVDQQLRSCLSRCETMNIEMIAQQTGITPDTVAARLHDLVARQEIEVLQPLTSRRETDDRSVSCDSMVFFRLIRSTDNDHLWEQELIVRLPACSAHKEREVETRRTRRPAERRGWSWRPVLGTAQPA